ncbi:MAG: putative DNA binding domain-containing protein, partial [Armatimonadetes bacterium]|nr:putative DNA binding domain-containing protein [Armatimonadota bacterium]
FPMIFVAQRNGSPRSSGEASAPSRGALFTQVKSLAPPYPDVKALIEQGGFELPPDAIRGAEWTLADRETLARLRRMERSGVPLGEYVKGKIYRGILTGFNEAFVIDGRKRAELIAEDPKSAEIIKPLAVGDDVRKWRIRKRDVWLIVTKIGVDMARYPAVMRHLKQWEAQLRVRQDQGQHWWELRACAYYAEFDKPKIVYSEISKEPRFTLDFDKTYLSNTAYIAGAEDRFLLGVLNSASAWQYLATTASVLGDEEKGGRIRVIRQFAQRIPIPRASDADRAAIEALVQQILDLGAADPDAGVSEQEAEIDTRVEFLYFHQDEAPTYDVWVAEREAEKGTAVEEVRRFVAAGESSKVEFKETLEAGGTTPEHRAAVFHSVLKTICAFLNSGGGTVLIGVHDSGEVIGLERDGAANAKGWDTFQQKIANALRARFSPAPFDSVEVEPVDIDQKRITRVIVHDARGPVTLDGKLYIRNVNVTVELSAAEALHWKK